MSEGQMRGPSRPASAVDTLVDHARSAFLAIFVAGPGVLLAGLSALVLGVVATVSLAASGWAVHAEYGGDYDWFDCREDCATVVDLEPVPPWGGAEWQWAVGLTFVPLAVGALALWASVTVIAGLRLDDEDSRRWAAHTRKTIWWWAGLGAGVAVAFGVAYAVYWIGWNDAVASGFVPPGDPVPEPAGPASPMQPFVGSLAFAAIATVHLAVPYLLRRLGRL